MSIVAHSLTHPLLTDICIYFNNVSNEQQIYSLEKNNSTLLSCWKIYCHPGVNGMHCIEMKAEIFVNFWTGRFCGY